MSRNLYWRVVCPQKRATLGDGLKWAIEKQYGHRPVTLRTADIPFLEGVRAAQGMSGPSLAYKETAHDCDTLIAAIENNPDGVEVWIAE